MRSSNFWTKVSLFALCLTFVFAGVVTAQDLNQQKQEKINEIKAIDAKLKANPTAEEYEELIEKRKKLEAEVKALNEKLKADVEAMQKINAVKKAYNDGNNAFKLGQYQQALDSYNKSISLDSTFYAAYYGKGLTLKKMRQYREAVQAYQAAIRHNPTYTAAYLALGKIYTELNDYDKAVETYKKGVKNDPSSDKLYYELGAVYLNNKKDYQKAYQNFAQAVQLNPEYDLAFYSQGVSLIEMSRFDEAIMALENALAVTKRRNWESPYYRMAVAYNKQGNHTEAKKAAVQALDADDDFAPAAYEAGKACKELKQYDQAIDFFKQAAQDKVWKQIAEYEIDLIQNRDKYGLE